VPKIAVQLLMQHKCWIKVRKSISKLFAGIKHFRVRPKTKRQMIKSTVWWQMRNFQRVLQLCSKSSLRIKNWVTFTAQYLHGWKTI